MTTKHVTNSTELAQVFEIRTAVFIEEQGTPAEDEFDEYEQTAEHILVYDDNEPVASGRLRVVDGVGKLERICVVASHRKHGFGKVVVETLENMTKEKGLSKAKLHGQTQAEDFYKRLGYVTASDVFMEDNIPHVLMIKNM
ncbi:GNAT family N-acetyltransferase [Bacillus fonticola]|uniref:GNAT family N-acetyltransferase n=1 Tax=Bacillus fonticola TaxID=2728853 RepID=UPI001474B6FD|nr:GNAT family N-acetyltransferase [Bacillus fonticola]